MIDKQFFERVNNFYSNGGSNGKPDAKYIVIAMVLIGLGKILFRLATPFILIFCLNTLFKTGIEYSFTSWLAALLFIWFILGALMTTAPKQG